MHSAGLTGAKTGRSGRPQVLALAELYGDPAGRPPKPRKHSHRDGDCEVQLRPVAGAAKLESGNVRKSLVICATTLWLEARVAGSPACCRRAAVEN